MSNLRDEKLQSILSEFMTNTMNGIIVFDENDKIIFCNDAAARLYGYDKYSDLENMYFREAVAHCYHSQKGLIIDTDNLEDWFEYAEGIRRSEQHRRFEVDIHDGCWHLVSEQVVENGCLVVVSTDITDKKKAEIQLADMSKELFILANTDALTNTSNRRHFIEQANTERRRCLRGKYGYALLMLDLDYFKSINDTHGHACGDNVLIQVTQTIKLQIREFDLLGRVGGEEFAIFLPNITKTSALEIAERIRSSIEKIQVQVPCEETAIKVTTSIGVALDENAEKSIDEMFLIADRLLYKAKKFGRNLVAMDKK